MAQSSVPQAGQGVFIDRAVPGGTAVALYHGVFVPLPPLHVRAMSWRNAIHDVLKLSKIWGYGSMDERLDGVDFEEAASYWLILSKFEGVIDGYAADMRVGCKSHFAVGQLINHPPAGTRPNVHWQEFEWQLEQVPACANRVHKGLWYINQGTGEPAYMPDPETDPGIKIPLPGVVMIASRDLAPGEELFIDYKLAKPYPPWYTPVAV